jgi:hypothetical protein
MPHNHHELTTIRLAQGRRSSATYLLSNTATASFRWSAPSCANLQKQLLVFQSKWKDSKFNGKLRYNITKIVHLWRRVDRIVCFELGSLGDAKTSKPNTLSVIQHLMAHTIADYLHMAQPRDSGDVIQLFAEDETYCASCVNFLCSTLRGKDGTVAESVGFQIVENYASFTADLLNEHTLFVAFPPRGPALVPVMDLTAPGGPAGLMHLLYSIWSASSESL